MSDAHIEPARRRLTCMIVEDEAAIGMALEDEFRSLDYEVSGPFPTCTAALIELDRDPPDVAVLDTVLKDGSCRELARELRRRGIPFLIFSGGKEMHNHAPELAGAPWIVKPAEYHILVQAVEGLLKSHAGA